MSARAHEHMSRSSAVVYDVDNGDCDSDGFLTALTEEQMCTQSSITGLPNLLTRIIRILEFFKSDDRNIRIIICNSK